MANVPTLTVPDVGLKPTPVEAYEPNNRLLHAASEGGDVSGLAQGLSDVGNTAANIRLAQAQQDNERAAKDMMTAFEGKVRGITFGDGTPENPGYYSLKGQNALDGAKGAQNAIPSRIRLS